MGIFRTILLLPSIVASLIISAPADAQSEGMIDCSPGGHGTKCEVRLSAGQTFATIRFRPTIPMSPPGGAQSFAIRGRGVPVGSVKLGSDNTAEVSLNYATPPTAKDLIFVETVGESIVLRDTLHILPAVTSPTVEPQRNLAPYVWIRNTWIPLGLRIGVSPLDGTKLTAQECEQVRFSLQPMPEGDATPDSGRAMYANESPLNCFVHARWKLADAVGEQDLAVRIGDKVVLVEGIAREAPRIIVGVAHFGENADEDTRYCNDYGEPFEDCRSERLAAADSIKKTGPGSENSVWRTFFGVEAPFIVTRQPTNEVIKWLQRKVRVVAGSSFVKPEENFFVGLTLSPLYRTELEGLSLQTQVAWRVNGGLVGGFSVDGSGLLSNALKALGAPF
jgi:hypothetical protein